MLGDSIFALSSGAPPAAIAVVRISGPGAGPALAALAGRIPEARRATLAKLIEPSSGELLDNAIMLFFPGPNSATGEDLAELHLHGGRSVVRAVTGSLARQPGMREAQPGEFTRRAFENGRIDLAEAEGLADLLASETESQRRAALTLSEGKLSRLIEAWREDLLAVSAQVEAVLNFSDEGDVEEEVSLLDSATLGALVERIDALLAQPPAERLRDGVRVAIAGPPNAGKSSLINYLAGRSVAITSPQPGTTRDLVEAPVAIGGVPFLLIDTAGLRDSEDEIEAIGVERAKSALAAADIVLWLGEDDAPAGPATICVQSKSDLGEEPRARPRIRVSSLTGAGMDRLLKQLLDVAKQLLPVEGEIAVNARHRAALVECADGLGAAQRTRDLVIAAESLRYARAALDRITGRVGVEEMLDGLFGRFCIGK